MSFTMIMSMAIDWLVSYFRVDLNTKYLSLLP